MTENEVNECSGSFLTSPILVVQNLNRKKHVKLRPHKAKSLYPCLIDLFLILIVRGLWTAKRTIILSIYNSVSETKYRIDATCRALLNGSILAYRRVPLMDGVQQAENIV